MNATRAWVAIVLLAVAVVAAARVPLAPRFRIIGAREGLPATALKEVAIDGAGDVWMATSDGLVRYDGARFEAWRHGDSVHDLPGSSIQFVHVDPRNRVWAAIEGHGAVMLDETRTRVRAFDSRRTPGFSDDIWTIAGDGRTTWFGSANDGIYVLDDGGTMRKLQADDHDVATLPSNKIFMLALDPQGTLWVATSLGLARVDAGRVTRVPLPGPVPAPAILSVGIAGSRVWAGSEAGVFVRDVDGRWTQPAWGAAFKRPNLALKFAPDREGKLWIGGQARLWHVSPGEDPVEIRIAQTSGHRPIFALASQSDGALWTLASGLGAAYLRADWRHVAVLQHMEGQPLPATSDYRATAPARDGGFWAVGFDGDIEHVLANGRIVTPRVGHGRALLQGTRPFSALEDRAGNLWIGDRAGLLRLSPDGRVRRWDGSGMGGGREAHEIFQVQELVEAPDGTIWSQLGYAGVQQRDPHDGHLIREVGFSEDALLGVHDIGFAADGRLWATVNGRVQRLDASIARFEPVPGIDAADVNSLAFDGRDVLWVDRAAGLQRYSRDAVGRWHVDGPVVGGEALSAVEANAMAVDPRHGVWMATLRGLWRWDPVQSTLRHYGVEQGLGSQEMVQHTLVVSRDGDSAMVAASDGALVFLDTTVGDAGQAPALRIDGLSIRRDGKWAEWLPANGDIAPDERELRIGMHMQAFDDPQGVLYWSRLRGIDHDWVAQGNNGERVLTGLAAGHYLVDLRAVDAEGHVAPVQTFGFGIRPAWWRTLPARVAGILLALLLLAWLALGVRRRARRAHAYDLARQQRVMAEQASVAKTHFLATLGHEIRTPMTGVLGMAELLESSSLDAGQRGKVESIRRAGEHLLRLVNDALDLARIEAGRMVLSEEPFDLHGLVHDIAGWARGIAIGKGLRFDADPHANLPCHVRGDAVRLRQILMNLLGNAIKFTGVGRVWFRVEPMPEAIAFAVGDTGPGMNTEQCARLFRRFEQAEGARTASRYGGSGLGLAICQELAGAMGGRIDVHSQPGVGTTFRVELPLPLCDAVAQPVIAAVGPPHHAVAQHLLLVEDDLTVAEVLRGLLAARGHRVVHVLHGLAALAEIATSRFDVALLDLDLPGMSGLDLAGHLRGSGFEGALVAITARADGDVESQAREAGFDGFLRKPLTGALLAEALAAMPARVA